MNAQHPHSSTTAAAQPATLLCLLALTPVHVGAGRGQGAIDLPTVREAVTHLPYIPSSEIKGSLSARSAASADLRESEPHTLDEIPKRDQELARYAFGVSHKAAEGGGAIVFCDARLVCFPARSLYGTFAWLACPLTLQRLKTDLETFLALKNVPEVPDVTKDNALLADEESSLSVNGVSLIEDLQFQRIDSTGDLFGKWASLLAQCWFQKDTHWQQAFLKRFAVVSDEAFVFLTDTACEVRPRVRLEEDSKTVKSGNLWYEEYLPQEALLAAPVWCERLPQARAERLIELLNKQNEDPARALLDHYCKDQVLRLGGKQSIGKGQCRARFGLPSIEGAGK